MKIELESENNAYGLALEELYSIPDKLTNDFDMDGDEVEEEN